MRNKLEFDHKFIENLFPIWENSQIGLHKVKRWGNYYNDGIAKKNMWKQSSLQHSFSFILSIDVFVLHIQPYIIKVTGRKLDEAIMLRSAGTHDLPEGYNEIDVSAVIKTDIDDLAEFLAFKKRFQVFPFEIYKQLEYSYLMQFALKNPDCFPKEAREVMINIQNNHYFEAMTKNAFEKFEYLFFPAKAKRDKKHPYLLLYVLRRQIGNYREYAEKLPGFREILFTYEFQDWAEKYLEGNKHIPDPIF